VQLQEGESRGADSNVYWRGAALQIEEAIRLYAECLEKYGDGEWRESKPPHVLADPDLPQMMFS